MITSKYSLIASLSLMPHRQLVVYACITLSQYIYYNIYMKLIIQLLLGLAEIC